MDKKILIWAGALILLGIIVIAQTGGLGGAGGSLGGINLSPRVQGHTWKVCPIIEGVNLTIDYEIHQINYTEKWFIYTAILNFDYGINGDCQASIGRTRVVYDENRGLPARTALVQSLRAKFMEEYNKEFSAPTPPGIRGNFTQ